MPSRIIKNRINSIYKLLYNRFGPQHWWPGDTPFEVMVGAILTQNTAWKNVERAIDNMKEAGILDPYEIYKISGEELARIIKPSGFFNIKARRLKDFIAVFIERYRASIKNMKKDPDIRKHLLEIPGIGKETADSILLYALEIPIFVVDAYTKRIFRRHFVIDENADYDTVQKIFMASLPEDTQLFNEYHALIVRLAKEYCRKKPVCKGCPLEHLKHTEII